MASDIINEIKSAMCCKDVTNLCPRCQVMWDAAAEIVNLRNQLPTTFAYRGGPVVYDQNTCQPVIDHPCFVVGSEHPAFQARIIPDLERLARAGYAATVIPTVVGERMWDDATNLKIDRGEWRNSVRAIIQALREPSEGMTEVGRNLYSIEDWETRPWNECVNGLFRAMIDHVLEVK